jgi:hypothetical protein
MASGYCINVRPSSTVINGVREREWKVRRIRRGKKEVKGRRRSIDVAVKRHEHRKRSFLLLSVGCESIKAVHNGVARMAITGEVDVSTPRSENDAVLQM